MQLVSLDWIVIGIYGIITVLLGVWFTRRAGSSVDEYFAAGRSLPWWLAGTSLAATWFATDAPLAAASLVRQHGIFGNWLWWYEASGIMLVVFFYAKLWRRAELLTDAEFIELRYSGRSASALRGFTAVYQGVLKNCVVMGWVMLAMIKFSQVLLGWNPEATLAICIVLSLAYTVASGLWGVVVTDFFQFITGTIGALILMFIVLDHVGGPTAMAEQIRAAPENPVGALDILPNPDHLSSLEFVSYILLIFVLWMRSGQGDGYLAQRLFATRDDRQSFLSALWFSFVGMAMTWPWIIVGLGSLIVFPLATASPELLADPELAYPMMIGEMMPMGLRGLVVASFLAAFMSTMDTHLCWGGSYMVTDVYRRFIKKDASEKHYVVASRVSVLILVIFAAITAWQMDSIERAWIYLIELTAGIAIVWLLRWYWWRVNAWAEITAIVGSFLLANGAVWGRGLAAIGILPDTALNTINTFYGSEYDMVRAIFILITCTVLWVSVALLTKPDDEETLRGFYTKVRPGGWWGPIAEQCPDAQPDERAGRRWLGWFMGVLFVYASLLGLGYISIGQPGLGSILVALSLIGAAGTLWMAKSK